MSVKLLFPMVLFIFPAILIVMVGPAGIRLFGVMSQ
jgi:pilus assembly protein TadC